MKKRFPIKLLLYFIISFLIISIIHISFNATVIARQPSPNWSRGFQVATEPFTRDVIADITEEGDIVILTPVKEGKDALNIIKLNKDMEKVDEYTASIEKFNINQISLNDVLFVKGRLYWRDNKENILYTSVLDYENKKFTEVKILQENVLDFDVTDNGAFLAVVFFDNKVSLYENVQGKYNECISPSMLDNVQIVNIKFHNDVVYLQLAVYNNENMKKEVYISEYKDNRWSEPIYMTSLIEVKNYIKDMELAIDKDYIYSISSVQGDDKTTFTYIINGYNRQTKELFPESKAKWAIDLKVQEFSSIPVMFDSDDVGVTIFTTAPNNLDIRVDNSNVIKLKLTREGFEEAELVSNTKKWSNQVAVLRNNNTDYVFWKESGGFGSTIIMGTSNNYNVISRYANITAEDVKMAVQEEIPYLFNLIIVLVGARLFNAFPAIIWLLCMFMMYNKIEKRYYFYLFIGMGIYLVSQVISMDFYYSKSYLMPELLTINSVKYLIPFVFAILAALFAFLYKKESDEPQSYKVYTVYLVYFHIMINYLFIPFLF